LTSSTRVLHVSDLHFGRPSVPEQIAAIARLIESGRFDVVAVSGDLSQRARAGEFQAAAVFLTDAAKVSRTIVVPGNHDVAWWFAPLNVGRRHRKYENYEAYVSTELEPVLHVPGATFIGINTSHGVTRRTLTWNVRDISIIGDLTETQFRKVEREVAAAPAADAKVVVMHHNPVQGELSGRHGLKRSDAVLRRFADAGVTAVLCGHDHQESVHMIEHSTGGVVVSTAGTVSNRSRGGRPSSMNVLTFSADRVHVETLVWSAELSDFRPGAVQEFGR
jgi:3',5'-cyclic AMP phosphodiesterase CpdA